MGLFGTDVVTDWLNGSNLIQEGHVAWGLVMVMLPFLPGAVVGVYVVWSLFHKKEYFKFFLSVLFYVPGVVLGTPYYMIIVILASCVKLFKPDLDKEDKVFGWIDAGFFKTVGPGFRMGEIVGESCQQSMLGKFPLKFAFFPKSNVDLIKVIVINIWSGIYIQIILGPSKDKTTRTLQYLGLGKPSKKMAKVGLLDQPADPHLPRD